MTGDTRAATLIANMVFRVLQQDDGPEDDVDLSAEDQAILDNYDNRNCKQIRVRHRTRSTKVEKP